MEKLQSMIRQVTGEQKQVVGVSEDQMAALAEAFDRHEALVYTPPDELRYIEGLADLPLRKIEEFNVIPAPGSERCDCGRVPTAADVVATALRRHIHEKSMIRNTLLGTETIVERADQGREAECLDCGRKITLLGYRKKSYIYA